MFTALFAVIKVLLGFGLAGIFMIIGLIACSTWLIRRIFHEIAFKIYLLKEKNKKKGGE